VICPPTSVDVCRQTDPLAARGWHDTAAEPRSRRGACGELKSGQAIVRSSVLRPPLSADVHRCRSQARSHPLSLVDRPPLSAARQRSASSRAPRSGVDTYHPRRPIRRSSLAKPTRTAGPVRAEGRRRCGRTRPLPSDYKVCQRRPWTAMRVRRSGSQPYQASTDVRSGRSVSAGFAVRSIAARTRF
jgi:hypothetical protein